MSISQHPFGVTPDGEKVTEYTMTNRDGASVSMLDFGGIITRILVPDRDGKLDDVSLSFDDIDVYAQGRSGSMGMLIGRVGNRIRGASFELEGRTYTLPKNNNGNCLHGGMGFGLRMWQARPVLAEGGDALELTLTSQDGDQGFPGTLKVKVTYTFTDHNELGIHYTEEIGEAAFYGPKLDVNVRPAVGAEYTLSTCQLDFCLPAKFHLTYVDKDGTEKTPVVLHRAILGSLDRFMAYLIEETKGKFPTWLAPTQVKVLPVSEKTLDYAEGVTEKLVEAGVRVVLDDDNQKIGYKIREAQQVDRVPYMLVLGAKEAEAGNISVRDRKGETTTMELDAFIAKVTAEIRNRSL